MNSPVPSVQKVLCSQCKKIIQVSTESTEFRCTFCGEFISLAKSEATSWLIHIYRYGKTLSELIFDYRLFFYHTFLKPYTPPRAFFFASVFLSFSVFRLITLTKIWVDAEGNSELLFFWLGKTMAIGLALLPVAGILLYILTWVYFQVLPKSRRPEKRDALNLIYGYALGSATLFLPFREVGIILALVWVLIMATLGLSIHFEMSRRRSLACVILPLIIVFTLVMGTLLAGDLVVNTFFDS